MKKLTRKILSLALTLALTLTFTHIVAPSVPSLAAPADGGPLDGINAATAGFEAMATGLEQNLAAAQQIMDSGGFLATIGEPDPNAIPIATRADLEKIGVDNAYPRSGSYVLTADIDLSGKEWTPIGMSSSDAFSGTFDGQGHKINNLMITGNSYQFNGLFGYVSGAAIRNVGMVDTNIAMTLRESAGGIVGFSSFSSMLTIENCYNTGNVSAHPSNIGSSAGGIVGQYNSSSAQTMLTIKNCYNTGDVSATEYAGGIVGQYYSSSALTIENCYNTGNVYASKYAGGIAGHSFPPSTSYSALTIENCYNTGDVSAIIYAGGIIGFFTSYSALTIENCYNTGAVSHSSSLSYAGGIVGYSSSGLTIENCYNAGAVSALVPSSSSSKSYAGGIVGYSSSGLTIENCYNVGAVSASSSSSLYLSYAGGIVGNAYSPVLTIENCVVLCSSIIAKWPNQHGYIVGCNSNSSSTVTKSNNLALDTISGNPTDDTGDGSGGARITLAQAKQQNTYEALGWDFENIWGIDPDINGGFPYLLAFGGDTGGDTGGDSSAVSGDGGAGGVIRLTVGARYDLNKFYFGGKGAGTWMSGGASIAAVDGSGVVTGAGVGRTTVTFASRGLYPSKTFDISVSDPVSRIAFISDAHVGMTDASADPNARVGIETELAYAVNRALQMGASRVFLLGDNTNDGTQAQYNAIADAFTAHGVPTDNVTWLMGNHDYGTDVFLDAAGIAEKQVAFNGAVGNTASIPANLVYTYIITGTPVKTAVVTINPSAQYLTQYDSEAEHRTMAGYSAEAYVQLETALTSLKAAGYSVIIASHYPLQELQNNSLINSDNQRDIMGGLMKSAGAVMIYGHLHQDPAIPAIPSIVTDDKYGVTSAHASSILDHRQFLILDIVAPQGPHIVRLVDNDTLIEADSESNYGFSFGNTAAEYGYTAAENIPLDVYKIVFGEVEGATRYESGRGKWYGNCFGVASTVQLLREGLINLSDFTAAGSIYSVPRPADSADKRMLRRIEANHLAQTLPAVSAQRLNAADSVKLQEIVTKLQGGDLISIDFFNAGLTQGHTVAGISIEDALNASSEYVVHIYDNMHPGTVQYLYIKSDYSDWRYSKQLYTGGRIGALSSDLVQTNVFNNSPPAETVETVETNASGGVTVNFGSTSAYMDSNDLENEDGTIKRGFITGGTYDTQIFYGQSSGGAISLTGAAPDGETLNVTFISPRGGAIVKTSAASAVETTPGGKIKVTPTSGGVAEAQLMSVYAPVTGGAAVTLKLSANFSDTLELNKNDNNTFALSSEDLRSLNILIDGASVITKTDPQDGVVIKVGYTSSGDEIKTVSIFADEDKDGNADSSIPLAGWTKPADPAPPSYTPGPIRNSNDSSESKSDDEPAQPADPAKSIWTNPFTDIFESDWFYSDVAFVQERGLMTGVSATEFAPNAKLTRAMLVTVLYRYASVGARQAVPSSSDLAFTDVPANAWYSDAITWAAANGIVNGVGDNKFAPDEYITREQFATVLFRFAKEQWSVDGDAGDLAAFTDIDEISAWAADAVKWAVSSGLINGRTATTLAPLGTATRAEAAALLRRYIERAAQ